MAPWIKDCRLLFVLVTLAAFSLVPFFLLGDGQVTLADKELLHARKTSSAKNLYLEAPYCPFCVHRLADSDTRCGELLLPSSPSSLVAESRTTPQELPTSCRRFCFTCQPQERKFWRYDHMGPVIQSDTVPFFPSFAQYQLPATVGRNLTAWILGQPATREYFFSYNPSIIVLPPRLRQKGVFPASSVYLASFRVSNQHYCFHPSERKLLNGVVDAGGKPTGRNPPIHQDFFGLALLDANLNVIEDGVLDVKAVFPQAEDFRLFLLGKDIYITSYDLVTPLRFVPFEGGIILPQTLDSNLSFKVYVRSNASCSPCRRPRSCGKNLNYFVANNTAFVEIWPSQPRVVRSVSLSTSCQRNQEPEQEYVDESAHAVSSFATVEEVHFPRLGVRDKLLTRGRGGACCVNLTHPATGEALYLGISHTKTPSQGRPPRGVMSNHYLSQLYAFASTQPFRLVAQSGLFCLGFPSDEEASPLIRLTRWRELVIGESFDCPRIHFVSGVALKVDDPRTLIIAYGVNDCFSRIVEVSMTNVEKLLFGKSYVDVN